MQAAYGPDSEGNESDYTIKESHEPYSDKESQASKAEDEQVSLQVVVLSGLCTLHVAICLKQFDTINLLRKILVYATPTNFSSDTTLFTSYSHRCSVYCLFLSSFRAR